MCVLVDFCLILISTQQTPLFLNSTWCYDFIEKSLALMLGFVKQNPSSAPLLDHTIIRISISFIFAPLFENRNFENPTSTYSKILKLGRWTSTI
jgi:hypothetical protein